MSEKCNKLLTIVLVGFPPQLQAVVSKRLQAGEGGNTSIAAYVRMQAP
jgi:hypothetical protein